MQREVLIAYQMNSRDLPKDHGYPVRAIVPGHYGMASVKWLTHIYAAREPFEGYWQTSDYGYWDYLDGMPVRRALREMKLKSEIARPSVYATLAPNQVYTVFGAAWAGETEVAEIAVSTDGGHTWAEAEFLVIKPNGDKAYVLFSHVVQIRILETTFGRHAGIMTFVQNI